MSFAESSQSADDNDSKQTCYHFEFSEILTATKNFDKSLVIGSGGFGKVYKANISKGTSLVVAAIKRLDPESSQGPNEFWAEVKMLSMLHHHNIVPLIGCCIYGQEKILVYEYMSNGTLDDHLHKRGTSLSWLRRLKICLDAGLGLRYLHNDVGVDSGVIHRDFKSSNVLLHDNWTARISDFGLSKTCPTNRKTTHVSTKVKGSFGYFDPNYFRTGKLTRKSDVYAFGVVLLEVLCRKPAVDKLVDDEWRNLATWAQDSIKNRNFKHIIDADIRSEISPKCLKEFVRIVERCLHDNPEQRPTMAEVVVTLESIVASQEKFNMQATSSRTIFDRMADMLPFTSNGGTMKRSTVADGGSGGDRGSLGFSGKLNKSVEVLDTLGSSMTNLNANSGFVSNMASRGDKVSILAFEVANTIVKGSNLMQSLSEESIQVLKKKILHSDGVRLLVSTDMKELLRIAASDKREELEVFSREVVRFGNMCKDPQWHNLDRFFSKLDSELVTNKQLREEAETTMQELTNLAQYTSELYHEYHALDRFEQDYRRKLEEAEALNLPRKGESLTILHSDVKHQRKLVRNLKKKSLWSKSLEDVVERLVDIVTFIHQEIAEAFAENVPSSTATEKAAHKKPETLGVAGLALHYANLVTQMDNIAAQPISLPPNTRDNLYNGLPAKVKADLRSRIQALDSIEGMAMPQIKAEMERTLQWLVPVATDTIKAYQGFGWVGEWANTGNDFGKKTAGSNRVIRLQTLYHADKQKMDRYILDLIVWLHRLVCLVRFGYTVRKSIPARSPPGLNNVNSLIAGSNPSRLKANGKLQRVPGISKSQEFRRKKAAVFASSRSMGSSPKKEPGYANADMLDVLDGLGTTY